MLIRMAPVIEAVEQVVEVLLTERELAKRWRVPLSFLRRRRALGLPPEYLKLGPYVRYPVASVEKFATESRRGISGEA
jgi:hypothetical protein